MIETLKDLVAPLEEAEFLRLLRDRDLKLVRRPGDRRFADMLGWARLREIIESDSIKPEFLRVMWKQRLLDHLFYRRNGRVDQAMLAGLLDRGASIIANRLERCVPEIANLCESLNASTGECARLGAIVTTGEGGALPLHYDDGDILVVQIEGTKRWLVYDRPVSNPVARMPRAFAPDASLVLDATLGPGDLLFVPGGYWHRCENGPGLSLHIGVHFMAPTGRDAFMRLVEGLADDELFRVRLTRLGVTQRAAHEAAMRERLIERIRLTPIDPSSVLGWIAES